MKNIFSLQPNVDDFIPALEEEKVTIDELINAGLEVVKKEK
jgi:hypothetical protein